MWTLEEQGSPLSPREISQRFLTLEPVFIIFKAFLLQSSVETTLENANPDLGTETPFSLKSHHIIGHGLWVMELLSERGLPVGPGGPGGSQDRVVGLADGDGATEGPGQPRGWCVHPRGLSRARFRPHWRRHINGQACHRAGSHQW